MVTVGKQAIGTVCSASHHGGDLKNRSWKLSDYTVEEHANDCRRNLHPWQ